jgi:hypothetical protein
VTARALLLLPLLGVAPSPRNCDVLAYSSLRMFGLVALAAHAATPVLTGFSLRHEDDGVTIEPTAAPARDE